MARLRNSNSEYREREKSEDVSDTVCVIMQEQLCNIHAHHISQRDNEVCQHENWLKSAPLNPSRCCTSAYELIAQFFKVISHGPIHVCSSCDQLF